MGRNLQKYYDEESQIALFMPILEGIDGKEKMSKSLGNYIGINEKSDSMYGKVMSIPDELIIKYYELATDIHPDIIDTIKEQLDLKNVNPRDIKMNLAKEIVTLYHDEAEAISAEENFKNIFQKKKIPNNIKELAVLQNENDLVSLIVKAGFALSKSESRRLISGGAVKINGVKVDENCKAINEDILQVGKLKYIKLKVSAALS